MIKILYPIIFAILFANSAEAVLDPNNNPGEGLFVSFLQNDFNYVVGRVIEILLGVAGTIALIMLLVGGMQYILSGANEELATKGRKTATNSLIGLIIILLSYTIVTIVIRTLQYPAGAGTP